MKLDLRYLIGNFRISFFIFFKLKLFNEFINIIANFRQVKVFRTYFFWYFNFFQNSFLYFTIEKMKHSEKKFASTDFKVIFLSLKKVKYFFLLKNRFFKKSIRNLPLEFYLQNLILYKTDLKNHILKYDFKNNIKNFMVKKMYFFNFSNVLLMTKKKFCICLVEN